MAFLSIIGIIILCIWISRLQQRIEDLEDRAPRPDTPPQSTTVAPEPIAAPVSEPVPVPAPTVTPPVPPVTPPPATSPPLQTANLSQPPVDYFAWFKEHTLIKIGALLFFLGAIWFVSYAVTQGWVSPTLRIFLGLLLGLGAYGIGSMRAKQYVQQYLTLTALGTGIIIASIFAGQFIFDLFQPVVALIIILLSIGYTVFVSLKTNMQWLAISSVIASFLAPHLINAVDPSPVLFLTYLGVISLVFLGVVFKTYWRTITLLLSVSVALSQLIVATSDTATDTVLWVFALLFAALFYAASTVSLIRSNEPRPIDITTLGFNVIVLTSWTLAVTNNDALACFVFALITASTGYFLYLRGSSEQLIAIYSGISLLFSLLATTLAFDGFTLTIAYALEISVAITLIVYLRLPLRYVVLSCVAFVLPVISNLQSFDAEAWNYSSLHPDAYAA